MRTKSLDSDFAFAFYGSDFVLVARKTMRGNCHAMEFGSKFVLLCFANDPIGVRCVGEDFLLPSH